jgi:hypothetical protein
MVGKCAEYAGLMQIRTWCDRPFTEPGNVAPPTMSAQGSSYAGNIGELRLLIMACFPEENLMAL